MKNMHAISDHGKKPGNKSYYFIFVLLVVLLVSGVFKFYLSRNASAIIDDVTISTESLINQDGPYAPIGPNSSYPLSIAKIAVTSSSTNELTNVRVYFSLSGFSTSTDLAALATGGDSGVSLFDVSAGTSVPLSISSTYWTGPGNNEVNLTPLTPIALVAGNTKNFLIKIVLNGSANNNHIIQAYIPAGGVTTNKFSLPSSAHGINSLKIDMVGPQILGVEKVTDNSIDITFNENVKNAFVTSTSSYSFSPPMNVLEASQYAANSNKIKLVVAGSIVLPANLAVASSVRDMAHNPNTTNDLIAVTEAIKLKISEVATRYPILDKQYVEIYNAGSTTVTQDLRLMYSNSGADGTWTQIGTIPSTSPIHGYRHYLFGTPQYNGVSPTIGDNNIINEFNDSTLNQGGGVLKLMTLSGQILDKVGWGWATTTEGCAAPAPPASYSIERKAYSYSTATSMASGGTDYFLGNGWDSDNNYYDFVQQYSPNPQNLSSATEQPSMSGGGGGGSGYGPTIGHTPINLAPLASPLSIVARMGDPLIGIQDVTAELRFKIGNGYPQSGSTSSYSALIGTHIGQGYFRFIVPQSTIDLSGSHGLYYYLKVVTPNGIAYMSASSTADNSKIEDNIAKSPFIVSVQNNGTWLKHDITGIVMAASGTPFPIENAFVFTSGFGATASTSPDGRFTLSDVKDGVYDIILLKEGYYEEWRGNIFLSGANFDIGTTTMYAGSSVSGGDTVKPKVAWSSPQNGDYGIPPLNPAYRLFIGFSKEIDPATFSVEGDNVMLVAQGNPDMNLLGSGACVYQPSAEPYLPSDPYLGMVQLNGSVAGGLASSTNYYLILTNRVRDNNGNPLEGNSTDGNYIISFTAGGNYISGASDYGMGEYAPPYVKGAIPVSGSMNNPKNTKVNLSFSLPMDQQSIATAENLKLYKLTIVSGIETKTAISFAASLDTTKKNAILSPSAPLSAGSYRVEATGALKSAGGIWMGDPALGQNVNTYRVYNSYFQVGEGLDYAKPSVSGVHPPASALLSTSPGAFKIQFSESLDPSTVNLNTITLKRGTAQVAGSVSYEPMSHTVHFIPGYLLSPGAVYTLTVSGGATGTAVTDLSGNPLDMNHTADYTTIASADTIAPQVLYANGDDFSVAVSYSEPMNAANQLDSVNWPSSVLNPGNYKISSLVAGAESDPYVTPGGVPLSETSTLPFLSFEYDGITNTVIIKGFSFFKNLNGTEVNPHPTDFMIYAADITDKSGNLISGAYDSYQAPVRSSSDTLGILGPTYDGGGAAAPSTGLMGMMKAGAQPANTIANQTTMYFVNLPTSQLIQSGYQVLLSFPPGFDVSSAQKETRSPMNIDLNQENCGEIAFGTAPESSGGAANDGVTVSTTTRTVAIALTASGTLSQYDFLHLDLSGIRNTPIPRGPGTGGYSVDIKILKSDGSLSETIYGMPFYIIAEGGASLTLNTAGINPAHVDGSDDAYLAFLSSPLTGQIFIPISVDGDGYGSTTLSGFPAGQYYFYTEPYLEFDGHEYAGLSMSEPVYLVNGANAKNINLVSQTTGAEVTVNIKGGFGMDDIDVFAGGPNGYKVKTIAAAGNATNTVTFYLSDGNWNIGVGPAMPKGILSGAPPMPNWMPPRPVEALVSGNGTAVYDKSGSPSDSTLDFYVFTADKQIIGYVRDKADQPIANAEVWAYRPGGSGGVGANAKTDPAGRFVLKLALEGVYSVGAHKQGLPSVPDKSISVLADTGAPDDNPTADIYHNASLITTSSPFAFKLKKPGYTISGRVTNGTDPIAYAPVWASQPGGYMRMDAMTDASGKYILYVDNGAWTVKSYIPGYGDAEPQAVYIYGADVTQDLAPSASAVYYSAAGKVGIDSDGDFFTLETPFTYKPIRAVLYDSLGTYLGKEYNTMTDSAGNYRLDVPAGIYRIDIWTPEYGELGVNNQDGDNTLNGPADDDYANNPANVNLTSSNASTSDIIIQSGALRTISLNFINSRSGQAGYLNIEGATFSGSVPKPSGFRKTAYFSMLTATQTIQLVNGDYFFNLNIPGLGSIIPDPSPSPNGRDAVKNSIVVSANRTVDFTLTDTTQASSAAAISGKVYSGSIQAGFELSDAWVWINNRTSGYMSGVKTADDGSYSLTVPTDADYRIGASKPGYTPGQPININASATAGNINLVVNANTITISGYLYNDSNSNSQYDAGEEVSTGMARAETTDGAKKVQAPADGSGFYSLGVVDGIWKVYGVADGYLETENSSSAAISGSGATVNIKLASDPNWSSVSYSKPIVPASGGSLDNTDPGNTGVKLVIPPNALGNSNSSGNIIVQKTSALAKTSSLDLSFAKGISIAVADNSGQTIANLNDFVDIEMVFYKSEISQAIAGGETTYAKLKTTSNAYWDPTANDWVNLATTRSAYYKASALDTEWTLHVATSTDSFEEFIDLLSAGAVYADYKLAYSSKTNHFTIFAIISPYLPSGGASAPPNLPIASAVNGAVAVNANYCSRVIFDEWQSSCIGGYQYRNIISAEPDWCKLTAEQEASRKRSCGLNTIGDILSGTVTQISRNISEAFQSFTRRIALIIEEAGQLAKNNTSLLLQVLGLAEDPGREKLTIDRYLAIITRDLLDITEDMRDSIVHFIAYGTPTTVKLGEGERTGVLNSYKSAFSRLPGTSAEWSDVLKIANGRWPSERSGEKESAAIQIFKSVYRREANLSNPHDDAAVKIVAYGLLPSSRNLNSEKAAISIYKNIYKKAPATAQEWNTVRAIAYSGATR